MMLPQANLGSSSTSSAYEFSAHIVEVLKFDPRVIFCWIAVVALPLPNIAFLKSIGLAGKDTIRAIKYELAR